MSRRVGNYHWYLVRDSRGHDHIGLDLMKGRNLKLNEGPGRKGMGESEGTYYVGLPACHPRERQSP